MVVALLASKKAQIWLLPCWHLKSPNKVVVLLASKKSLDMVAILLAQKKKKSPNMVIVRLIFKKKKENRKKKSLDMVIALLRFLSNTTHVLVSILYSIKMS